MLDSVWLTRYGASRCGDAREAVGHTHVPLRRQLELQVRSLRHAHMNSVQSHETGGDRSLRKKVLRKAEEAQH